MDAAFVQDVAAVRGAFVHPNQIGKFMLTRFWDDFGQGRKQTRSRRNRNDTLQALREYGDFPLSPRPRDKVRQNRERFHAVKGRRCKYRKKSCCFVCGGPAEARHHIIQNQHGGLNSKKNLIWLCGACHAEIHPWLRSPEA